MENKPNSCHISDLCTFCEILDSIFFNSVLHTFRIDSTFWLDSTLKLNYVHNTIQYNTIICNAHKVEYRTSNLRRG